MLSRRTSVFVIWALAEIYLKVVLCCLDSRQFLYYFFGNLEQFFKKRQVAVKGCYKKPGGVDVGFFEFKIFKVTCATEDKGGAITSIA